MAQPITGKPRWQDINCFFELDPQDRLDLEPSYQHRNVSPLS
jgi:hypothetical protein